MKSILKGALAAAVLTAAALAQTTEVGQRAENQQDRIAHGIQSGKLNAAQASRLENGERAINQEVHTDRSLNGGKLTSGEKAVVNQRQNAAATRSTKRNTSRHAANVSGC